MQEPTRKDNVGRAACCLDIAAIPPHATRRARKGRAKKCRVAPVGMTN